ncbi:MAG: sulfotransferase [Bacteroidota bacterium]
MIRDRLRLARYDARCRWLRWRSQWRNWTRPPAAERYFLFVLCPTYGGSTLMQEILSTSPGVSPNNVWGTREGLGLPQVRRHFDYRRLWEADYQLPWPRIRREWEGYWQHDRPVLLEKSPSNLVHAPQMAPHFDPAYFVVMVRQPLAHCESLIRRDALSPTAAARFCLDSLRHQKRNLEQLPRCLLLPYEALVDQTTASVRALLDFLPPLQHLRTDRRFRAHNYHRQNLPLTNLNAAKIARLSADQREEINRTLTTDLDILSYFRYSIDP